MNYLALAKRARRKCRMAGTGPVSVTNQSEEYTRLLDWVNEAWMEIQRMRTDWKFMRASATAATVQGQYAYAATDFGITDLGFWALDYEDDDTFRNWDTAAGQGSEIFMQVWDYDAWRDSYLYGALRTSYTRPLGVAVAPDNTLVCGPIPAAGYTLSGDYYRVPTEMVDATDIPSLPVQFHMAIVYKTMMLYAASEGAAEVYDDGANSYGTILRQMLRTQTRRVTGGGALC